MYVILNYNVYMFVAILCKAISHDALKDYVLPLHVQQYMYMCTCMY